MHITEGIITGKAAVMYTGAGLALVGFGVSKMKKFISESPENKPLLGMGGAIIFFISLIPIPAFTGTSSHPCGTPIIAILLGPSIGFALTGASLLLQAAFFAHGGFGTWGANVVALGFFGCFFGWGAFRIARKMGFPLWAAGFTGGLVGDIMVYVSSGVILAVTFANGQSPQYSLSGYLIAIYSAYLPTQLPIAVGEMLVTGLALQYAYKQRPDVLEDLGIIGKKKLSKENASKAVVILLGLSWPYRWLIKTSHGEEQPATPASPAVSSPAAVSDKAGSFPGLDEAVNEELAQAAGQPAREPYINTEAMGNLWILLLLSAGGICGFVVGRWWHILWGNGKKSG
jgi:cobalt/nickel transport system permease protein